MSKKKAKEITRALTPSELRMLAKAIEDEIKRKEAIERRKLKASLQGG